MILGRSPNTWIGAVTAVFNAFVLFNIAGFNPTSIQIAGVNGVILAIIALIANNTASQVSSANAAIARDSQPPSSGTNGSVGGSAASTSGSTSSSQASSSTKPNEPPAQPPLA
jgi:hypothetical protein